MSQLIIKDLCFAYDGGETVFQNWNVRADTRWKLGLVGRNGRGKTTLLKLLTGELEGRGTLVCPEPCRRFPLEVEDPDQPVLAVLNRLVSAEEWQLIRELSRLGLTEEVLERPFSSLSGGEQTRALLAALFLDETHFPLVDEPTNHLDEAGRELVARYLRSLDRGFFLVSHDRDFLDRCVDHILALNRTGAEVVQGNFSTWFQVKEERERGETARNEKLKGEIQRLEQSARMRREKADAVERAKIGAPPKGGVKAGMRPYLGEKSRKGQRQRLNLERRAERALEEKRGLLRDVEHAELLQISVAAHHSARLVEGRDLTVRYGERVVFQGVDLRVDRGERVCLCGRNGSGKTSLLKLVLGEPVPFQGELWRAPGLEVAYLPQSTAGLSGTPGDWAEERGLDLTRFLTILRKLDLERPLFQQEMSSFSMGQKKKVLLTASLCRPAHLYVWDEPLNYVDLFSRMQIQRLLLEYQPTMLFVEHDRWFRDHVATRVLSL